MLRVQVAALLLAWLPASPVTAHHSVLAYDGRKPTTLSGTVVKVLWQNPHAYIDLEVDVHDGRERWLVESEGPPALTRLGWTKASLHPGDAVTITGARAHDGTLRLRCARVTLADGRALRCFPDGGTL